MEQVLEQIRDCIFKSYSDAQNECPAGASNPDCTTAVIQGLASAKLAVADYLQENAEHLNCCHRERGKVTPWDWGEWMLIDFTLTSAYCNGHEDERNNFIKWPSNAKTCGILLAAESAWEDVNGVLRDFGKLADVKADIKVMVYAYYDQDLPRLRRGFLQTLGNHRHPANGEKWLFMGFHWNDGSRKIHSLSWDSGGKLPDLIEEPSNGNQPGRLKHA
jgi:hypothetical protein